MPGWRRRFKGCSRRRRRAWANPPALSGGVTLIYRRATAQPLPGESAAATNRATSQAKAASAEKHDLESLRLEVEALRVSLQATRERVTALEAKEQAQNGSTNRDLDGRAKTVPDSQRNEELRLRMDEKLTAYQEAYRKAMKSPISSNTADEIAQIEQAAKWLRIDPKDEKALAALGRVAEVFRRLSVETPPEPKPAPSDESGLAPTEESKPAAPRR